MYWQPLCWPSYIEEFWYDRPATVPLFLEDLNFTLYRYESYLQHSDPVVLALNPFFVLE
jgi:hypothetical protein